jgi:hypothetical protein
LDHLYREPVISFPDFAGLAVEAWLTGESSNAYIFSAFQLNPDRLSARFADRNSWPSPATHAALEQNAPLY